MGGSVSRTLDILEVVAAHGGASAKDIADATGLPLPTVYRLVRELLDGDYLVHIKEEKRFELGYKLHALGVSLHEQIGVSRGVRAEVTCSLHQLLGAAAYLAVHRGSQIVVVFTADSPACPALPTLEFGYHEAAHATALGKILLANMDEGQRLQYLEPEPMRRFGPGTITTHRELFEQLDEVGRRGIAWEFWPASSSPVPAARRPPSAGAMAPWSARLRYLAPDAWFRHGRGDVEQAIRATASTVSRFYRGADQSMTGLTVNPSSSHSRPARTPLATEPI